MRNCEALGNDGVVMERKRKAEDLRESQKVSRSTFQLKTRRLDDGVIVTPANSGNCACESGDSDQILASCSSSNGSSEVTKENSEVVDLEENVDFCATPAGDSLICKDQRRETTPLSDVEADPGELETAANKRKSHFRRRTMAEKIPSESEIEDFFTAAEKNLHKQFTDKYNYDIVKDEPKLEGRYEWIPIQIHGINSQPAD